MDIMYGLICLVLANIVVGVVCRLAAPRVWGRWLCLTTMGITAMSVLWVVMTIAENAHLTESTAGIYALPGGLLFVELVWLIGIYLTTYSRRDPPERRPR